MKSSQSVLPFRRHASPADTFAIERGLLAQGVAPVAGLDEAGRGPLAGPVTAACVILPPDGEHRVFRDSKQLTEKARDELFALLHGNGAVFGIGVAEPEEIDRINILQAALLAMKRAALACAEQNGGVLPACLLVDGNFPVPLNVAQQTLIKGESKSASIAAASILAKVHRDRIMAELHERHPQYGWLKNKGYPTKDHRAAIARFGPCPLHRMTFRGVREFVGTRGSPPSEPGVPMPKGR